MGRSEQKITNTQKIIKLVLGRLRANKGPPFEDIEKQNPKELPHIDTFLGKLPRKATCFFERAPCASSKALFSKSIKNSFGTPP